MYMKSFVSIEAAGRLGADAKVIDSAKGKRFVRFSLAVDERTADKKNVKWFDISFFGDCRLAEILKKGSLVHVRGDLSVKAGDSRVFLGIIAREVNVLAFPAREAVQAPTAQSQAPAAGEERRRTTSRRVRDNPPQYDDVSPDDYLSCRAPEAEDNAFDEVYGR